jgi:hypothetical protein
MRMVYRVGEEKLEIVPEVENGILGETSELNDNQINFAVEKEKKGDYEPTLDTCVAGAGSASELTGNQINFAGEKEKKAHNKPTLDTRTCVAGAGSARRLIILV